MIRRPPRSTHCISSAASDVYKRQIPDEVIQVLDLVKNSHPMDALRTGISALAAFDPEVDDNSTEATVRKGIRLTSMSTTLVAAHHRLRQGLEPVAPNPDLSHAGNFLYMMFANPAEDYKANPILARAMDRILILHADHEQNASTSTVRLAGSSGANPFACIAAVSYTHLTLPTICSV